MLLLHRMTDIAWLPQRSLLFSYPCISAFVHRIFILCSQSLLLADPSPCPAWYTHIFIPAWAFVLSSAPTRGPSVKKLLGILLFQLVG
ncbi:hypothetical protein B0O80DRAFT_32540 [Mortierella sp. GBAus27b]|nr:hypothetical protein B0O80DRAFT_32540 [Mortierella sp. GBAus27b]